MEHWAVLLLLAMVAGITPLLLQRKLNNLRSRRSMGRLGLPPGPRPLPVFGNLFLLSSSKLWHRDFYALAQKYGPIMWLRLGSHGAVVVQSPELAMEVLKHQDFIFASRPPPSYVVGLATKNGSDVGFAPLGLHWRFMRKLMTTELLSHKRLMEFQHVRVEEVGRLVEAIHSHIGQPVNLTYLLGTLNLNNITKMCMSKAAVSQFEMEDPQHQEPAGKDTKEDQELLYLTKRLIQMSKEQGIGDAVPWLSFLDRFFIPKAEFEETFRQLDRYYSRVIQEHRQYRYANPESKPRNFVDLLLSVPTSGGEDMTDDIIKSQLLDMVSAGTDTTSSTTEWALAELLRQPAALEQAVQELHRVVGRSRVVAESDIPNLPYLHAVVKETLRMHPPVPLLIPHYSTHDSTVGGYHIPARTTVLVNVWALGRNPASWQDPDQFRPQRFLQRAAKEPDIYGHHFQLLPFGSGKRICPGMGLGLAMVHFTLATLLHSFAWSLPADIHSPEDLDMSEYQGMTINKAVPLRAVPALHA